jgi:hypothetical protein
VRLRQAYRASRSVVVRPVSLDALHCDRGCDHDHDGYSNGKPNQGHPVLIHRYTSNSITGREPNPEGKGPATLAGCRSRRQDGSRNASRFAPAGVGLRRATRDQLVEHRNDPNQERKCGHQERDPCK